MSIGLNLDIGGIVDTFTNDSKDQATASRDLSATQWNKAFQTDEMRWQEKKNFRKQDLYRADTSLQRMVADAKAAGIHPMAALGKTPSSPVSVPRSGNVPAGQTYMPDVRIPNLAIMDMKLDIFKKAKETKDAILGETSPTPEGQQQQTLYPTQKVLPVENSPNIVRQTDNRPPMVEMRRGPGGRDTPVADAEFEEWLFGEFLMEWDRYMNLEPTRKMWDELRKKPDRTGRFEYMKDPDSPY